MRVWDWAKEGHPRSSVTASGSKDILEELRDPRSGSVLFYIGMLMLKETKNPLYA